jgi:hypothetical protein
MNRFAVDPWAPEQGSAMQPSALVPSEVATHEDVEVALARWAPRRPAGIDGRAEPVDFVDGVQRIEATVWVTDAAGVTRQGLCASYGAGVVRCNHTATIVGAMVERAVFCPAIDEPIVTTHAMFQPRVTAGDEPELLARALGEARGALEVRVATANVQAGTLVVVDGPLSQHRYLANAVGSIKRQHKAYGSAIVTNTAVQLDAGERTPLFVVGDRWQRYTWYVRLPGDRSHPWAGIVRCEATTELAVADAVAVADRVTATLPRFASEAHKDPRAPQNLYPIGGLERELRRRLGDSALLYRSLRRAAHEAA